MTDSNAILAERFRQNDPQAFSQLFGRYHEMVFNLCLRMLHHRQDAEDVTQETFSRVARYIHRWDTRRPLEPWLVTIAGNRCRTHLARRSSNQALSLICEPTSSVSIQQQDADTLREEVHLGISLLPDKQRMAFSLFHEQSMSYDEIAAVLGCPVGTAKTWVRRARMNLMKRLQDRDAVSYTHLTLPTIYSV